MLCQSLDILDYMVDPFDDSVVIDRVRSEANGCTISIVVSESTKYENYVLWDVHNKCEKQSFRFEKGGRVFHSDDGKTFI